MRAAIALALRAVALERVASFNDACDCMQNHDYWVHTKMELERMLLPDFAATAQVPPLPHADSKTCR